MVNGESSIGQSAAEAEVSASQSHTEWCRTLLVSRPQLFGRF